MFKVLIKHHIMTITLKKNKCLEIYMPTCDSKNRRYLIVGI